MTLGGNFHPGLATLKLLIVSTRWEPDTARREPNV